MGRPRKVREPLSPIRTLASLSKCRGILIRWEEKVENYLGLLKLACVLLWLRRYPRLSHT